MPVPFEFASLPVSGLMSRAWGKAGYAHSDVWSKLSFGELPPRFAESQLVVVGKFEQVSSTSQ
jgi:hypothetical protein